MQMVIKCIVLASMLLTGCASVKTKRLTEIMTSSSVIYIMPVTATISEKPLLERIAEAQKQVDESSSPADSAEADVVLENDNLADASFMTPKEYESANLVQIDLANSFSNYHVKTVSSETACRAKYFGETEMLFNALDSQYAPPLYGASSFHECLEASPENVFVVARLKGSDGSATSLMAERLVGAVAGAAGQVLYTIAKENTMYAECCKVYLEIGIADAKGKVLSYDKSFLSENPTDKIALHKLVANTMKNMLNSK